MRVLYAPSSREMSDDLHNNVACGFDVLVLETLLEANAEVLYMPHSKTNQIIKDSIAEIFKDSITLAETAPQDIEICTSDISSIALKYALWTQNPSLLCLFGFNEVAFPDGDKYFSLMQAATHCVYSLNELKDSILYYPKLKKSKADGILEAINGDMI